MSVCEHVCTCACMHSPVHPAGGGALAPGLGFALCTFFSISEPCLSDEGADVVLVCLEVK